MANEIALNVGLSVTISGATTAGSRSKSLDLTGDQVNQQTASIGFAADEQLQFGAIDTVGQLLVENLDATNFVQLSYDTGTGFAAAVFAKIRPGCACLLEPNSATIYAKADTAAVSVRTTAVEV